ncbi:hypothetical protein [Magnetovibrio sp.]|uniref:hypothetical protein n=1 Tax=Magnetovibrio sp. TaxID=2024836 RepID=UPI002F94B21A
MLNMESIYRVIISACIYNARFHLTRFILSRFEAPLIALALYSVQVNLLGEFAFERFLLSWLGVVILMWTMKTILRVNEALIIHGKIYGVLDSAGLRSALGGAGILFVDFLVDMVIIVAVMAVVRDYVDIATMLGYSVLVVLTQGTVNFSVSIFHLAVSRWFNVKNIMVVAFVIFAIMSPVLFMFHDLNQFGNKYFTSINPASHFLAAYYNIFWFQQPVSIEVLPFFFVLAIGFIVAYCVIIEPRDRAKRTERFARTGGIRNLSLGRFEERSAITGLELFFNFYALGPHAMSNLRSRVEKLAAMEEFQDQFYRSLSTYSRLNDLHMDLILAACLAGPEETHVSLPDDDVHHVSDTDLRMVLGQINDIMGTNLSLSLEALPISSNDEGEQA